MVLLVNSPVLVDPHLDLRLKVDADGERRGVVDNKLLGKQFIGMQAADEDINTLI